jgi:predicted alpha/beta superfamily hydrolase
VPRYTLEGTEVRVVHSDLTGKDHELIIGLPPSFAKEPTRQYPVLYLLDGQWDFALLNTLSGGLRYDQVMPEMLIVGLSYAGTEPDYDALRADDYTPTKAKDHQGKVLGGGGGRFLEFLEMNVMPLAEREYRGDPTKRILSGSSYGGLFTLFALLEKPELFQAYVSISPAVGWDDHYLAKREKEFHKTHSKLDRRVWLSIGDSEWPGFVADAKAFIRQFEASRYSGMTLKSQTIVGERHAGVKPEAYNRAMRFVSEPWLPKAQK